MLVLLVLAVQIVLPAFLAFVLAQRSEWSQRKIVLLAALPVPILMWGSVLVLLTMMLFAPADVCDGADGCSSTATAATVTAIVGATLYALGMIGAVVCYQLGKRPPKEKLDDIFR